MAFANPITCISRYCNRPLLVNQHDVDGHLHILLFRNLTVWIMKFEFEFHGIGFEFDGTSIQFNAIPTQFNKPHQADYNQCNAIKAAQGNFHKRSESNVSDVAKFNDGEGRHHSNAPCSINLELLRPIRMSNRLDRRTYAPCNPSLTSSLPIGNFNVDILNWMEDKALIYIERLSNFVTREGRRCVDAPTNFFKQSLRQRPSFPKWWILTSTWCYEYGTPDWILKAK